MDLLKKSSWWQTWKATDKSWDIMVSALVLTLVLASIAYVTYQYRVLPTDRVLDFRPTWQGSQLMLRGQNPYHYEYGHHRYVYPAIITVMLLPMMLLPLDVALSVWATLQLAFVVTSIFLWFDLLHLQFGPLKTCLIVLALLVGWRYPMINYASANFVGYALFCLSLGAWLYHQERDIAAGAILAFGTIRPEAAVMIGLFLLWMLSQKRGWPLVSCVAVLVFSISISIALAGFWLPDFYHELLAYPARARAIWPPSLISPVWLRMTLSGIVIAAGLVNWRGMPDALSAIVLWVLMFGISTNPYVLTHAIIPLLALSRRRGVAWIIIVLYPWWRPVLFPAVPGLHDLYLAPLGVAALVLFNDLIGK